MLEGWNTRNGRLNRLPTFHDSNIPTFRHSILSSLWLIVSVRRGRSDLDAIELGIKAATCYQLVVGTFLGDHAVFENEDFVGIPDGALAVRDGNLGTCVLEPLQGVDHQFFRLGVEGGGGFVKNQDRCIADNRPRNADALPLAT
jgi:hypothetical protein